MLQYQKKYCSVQATIIKNIAPCFKKLNVVK